MENQPTNHELSEKFYALQLLFDLEVKHKTASPLVAQQGQGNILMTLAKDDGLSQHELSERLDISAPSVSEFIRKLSDKGYVKKQKSATDGRVMLVYLTDRGKQSLAGMQHVELDGWNYLTKEQQKTMAELLDTMIHNMSHDYKDGSDQALITDLQNRLTD